ncbi:thiamine-phosphate kinase [Arthrobacter sp.]|uniref:thiamine-phosphate kinase n=1 Tax=Arthrobacter sp. TaxID=1667 RepID=UPI003A94BD7E
MQLTVAGLGESGLLERILPRLQGADMLLGPGDDAAVIEAPGGRFVFTVDTLVQDQDFRLLWRNGYRSTGYDVGWKSAAQNLSDINAMGAVATAAVISLTLPPATPVVWAEGIAEGFTAAVRELGAQRCGLAGGDLSSGGELSITAALTGSLSGPAVLRSGARPGDVVAVCGVLGAAAAGLSLLESDLPHAALDDAARNLVALHCRPRPPLWAGPAASAAGASAMMDISDGLVRDGGRIAHASSVAINLDSAALHRLLAEMSSGGVDVMAAAERLGGDPLDWVLAGGEDHGLLACFPRSTTLPAGFHPVGSVLEAGRFNEHLSTGAPPVVLDSRPLHEAREALRGPGFDHFGG